MTSYTCQKCGRTLYHTPHLIMTSYPINWVLWCPNCDEDYYLLVDKVLCSAEEYDKRINQYY